MVSGSVVSKGSTQKIVFYDHNTKPTVYYEKTK